MARPQFAATPSGRRYSDRTLEFPTEVIDVAKSARFGDLGKRRIVPDDEGLRIYETFPLQPSARARAQMPAKQPPDLRWLRLVDAHSSSALHRRLKSIRIAATIAASALGMLGAEDPATARSTIVRNSPTR
jgi:hypothetical protein